MRRKCERLERIERIRKRIHELSTWRLARVAQEREKLAAAHAEMIEAMGDGLMSYGAPAVAGARKVRAIESELAIAALVEKKLEQQTLDHRRLAKLADQSLQSAREEWREVEARRSLEALIEATIASRKR